jgi:hypothetical protein
VKLKHLILCSGAWAIAGLLMTACSDSPSSRPAPVPIETESPLSDTPLLSIPLQEVVNAYVLGGNSTDLQRQALTAKLLGATVVWRFKVYDIAKEDGHYRVMSELMQGTDATAAGKFTVVAFVTPRDDADVQKLLGLKTGSDIEIRGRVAGVTVRTALVLSPAEMAP